MHKEQFQKQIFDALTSDKEIKKVKVTYKNGEAMKITFNDEDEDDEVDDETGTKIKVKKNNELDEIDKDSDDDDDDDEDDDYYDDDK